MQKNKGFIFLIALILLLIGLKVPSLSLPYFWDEAWPYSTAVHLMYENGLSLLPGAIPFDISRGHPLFFHFMNASAMHLLGNSIAASHLFPLLISILLLIVTYLFCLTFFSEKVAIIASSVLFIQPLFLAQSALLLPEMMVALLSLLTIYCFLKNNRWLYLIFGTFLLLTKESGIVVVLCCGFWQLIEVFVIKKNKFNFKNDLLKLIFIGAPILLSSVFFILQKIKTGYFFLPLYTNGDNFMMTTIFEKFKNYSAFLFIYQGRNLLSFLLIACLVIFFFIKKNKLTSTKSKIIFLLSIYIIFYLIFSSANFYSPRYLLSIFAPFVIIFSFFLIEIFSDANRIIYPVVLSIVGVGGYFCFDKKHVSDHSLSYVDAVEVSLEMTNYCQAEHLQDKNINANFLMRTYLTDKYAGYVLPERIFKNVQEEATNETEYLIQTSFEKSETIEQLKSSKKWELLKRFEKNYSYCEIYIVKNRE